MGSDLPKIHIEWDEAHAAGLKPELRTYQQIVSRLGSHDGVETSLDTVEGDERTWGREPADTPEERTSEAGDDQCGNMGGSGRSVLHDVRAMCRSLGRLRDLGATVMIDGREANTAALDAYEDALAREVRQIDDDERAAASDCEKCANGSESSSSFLSSIIYIVGLVVVLQWLFSCS